MQPEARKTGPNKAQQHYHEQRAEAPGAPGASLAPARSRSRSAAAPALILTPEHRRLIAALARYSDGGAPDAALADRADLTRREVARLGYELVGAGLAHLSVGLFGASKRGRELADADAALENGARS